MKKALLIYNPRAGRNNSRPSLEQILSYFPEDEFEIQPVTTGPSGAEECITNYAEGKELIIVCGGDGTLNESISGLLNTGRKIPIGYIPIGSTNDLANALNIPGDIASAAGLIRKGETHCLDIGSIGDRYFNYVACFGPGTDISYSTPQKMKNAIGYPAYILNGFVLKLIPNLKNVWPRHLRLEYDGKVIDDNFYFGAVSNATTVAGMIKYDRNDIVLNDGEFEVILVKKLRSRMDVFRMFAKLLRRDYDGDSLIYFKINNIKFTFDSPENWSVDGEIDPHLLNADIKVMEKAVEICCPGSSLLR